MSIDHTQRKAGAGFVCVPGSHQQFASIAEARRAQPGYKPPKKHFAPLEADSPLQQQAKLVVSPADPRAASHESHLLHRGCHELVLLSCGSQGFPSRAVGMVCRTYDVPLRQVSPANCLIMWDSRLLHRNYGGDWTAAELGRCPLRHSIA